MLQPDHFGGDGIAKGAVVFDKKHSWLIFFDERFDLQTRGEIDVIQWFVPDIEMGLFTETFGEQDLFLLAFRKCAHIAVEMIA